MHTSSPPAVNLPAGVHSFTALAKRSLLLLAMPLALHAGAPAKPKPAPVEPPRKERWVPTPDLQTILKAHPSAVLLTPEQYEALIRDAGKVPPPKDDTKPPASLVVESLALTGTITASAQNVRLEGTLTVRCLTDDWTDLTAGLPFRNLASVSVDGTIIPVPVAPPSANKKNQAPDVPRQKLLTRGKGSHTVRLSFIEPLLTAASGEWQRLPFLTTSYPASLKLTLPAGVEVDDVGAPHSVQHLPPIPVVPPSPDNRIPPPPPSSPPIVTLSLHGITAGTVTGLQWTQSQGLATQSRVLAASALATVHDDRLQTLWSLTMRHTKTSGSTFTYKLVPSGTLVLQVKGDEVTKWHQDGDTLTLTVPSAAINVPFNAILQTPLDLSSATAANKRLAVPTPVFQGEITQDYEARLAPGTAENIALLEHEGAIATSDGLLHWNPARAPLELTLRKAVPRLSLDADTHIQITRDDILLDRQLTARTDRPVTELRVTLPEGEEFLGSTPVSGPAPEWKRSGQAITYRFPSSLTPQQPAVLKLQSRKRLPPSLTGLVAQKAALQKPMQVAAVAPAAAAGPADAATKAAPAAAALPAPVPPPQAAPANAAQDSASTLVIENISVADAHKLSGYTALDHDPAWRLTVGSATGLEERDARTTPVKGQYAWFALRTFKLGFSLVRRDPVFDTDLIAYALPRARTIDIEGQLTLNVSESPLRQFSVQFPPALAPLVRFTSPYVAEQLPSGNAGLIALTLRRESLGRVPLRFRLSLPAEDNGSAEAAKASLQSLKATLPKIAVPATRRFTGAWIIEANTDTEITTAATAMQPLDVLRAPAMEDYQPRHRLVAAWQHTSPDATLSLTASRHAHSELAALVCLNFDLISVLSTDGLARHQVTLTLRHAGEQFVNVQLPAGAQLLSAMADGSPVKPVRGPDNALSIPLPSDSANRDAVPVRLLYELPGPPLGSAGTRPLAPPTLPGGIPILATDWQIYVPDGYTVPTVKTTLKRETRSFGDAEGGGLFATLSYSDTPAPFLPGGSGKSAEVVQALQQAKSYLDRGNYDLAEMAYKQALRLDPYNSTAQRGLELIAQQKPDYYDSARDATRARMLSQVAEAWEEKTGYPADKAKAIKLPSVSFKDATVEEAIEFLRFKSRDLDVLESDASRKGLNLILKQGDTPSTARINLELKDVTFEEALRYVTELAGMKYKVEPNAIVVVPVTESTTAQYNRVFTVPADFLTRYGKALNPTSSRLPTARDILEAHGVTFPQGASAIYGPATTQLIVKNTAPNLEVVARLLEGVASGATKEGLISLDLNLPTAGQQLRFTGEQAPPAMDLPYLSVERQIAHMIGLLLLGAVAFLLLARRSPWLMTALVLILGWLGSPSVLPEHQPQVHAVLTGWLAAFVLFGLWRGLHRLAARSERVGPGGLPASTVAGLLLLLLTTPAHAETKPLPPDPAAHEVIVPFDPKKPLAGQRPDRYYLDRADFDRLWALAKENRRPPLNANGTSKDKPEATLAAAMYRATVEEQRLLIEAQFEIVSKGRWAKAALSLRNAVSDSKGVTISLHELTLDGQRAALSPEGELLLEQPGLHKVSATYELPGARNWKSAAMDLPAASTATLLLNLPATDGVPGMTGIQTTSLEESADGHRTVTAILDPKTKQFTLTRSTRRPPSPQAKVPTASVFTAIGVREDLRTVATAQFHFTFPGSSRREVSVLMDPAWAMRTCTLGTKEQRTPSSISYRMENGQRLLLIGLPPDTSDEITATLSLEPVGTDLPSRTPLLVPSAQRWESTAALAADAAVELIPQPTAKQPRLADHALDLALLRLKTGPASSHYRLAAGETLAFQAKAASAKPAARVDYLFQLSEQKAELAAAITLKRERGAWRQFRLALPAGYELQSLTGPGLVTWEQQGQELYLRFADNTGAEARAVVHAALTLPQPGTSWKLAPLTLPAELEKVTGTAFIAAHAATETRLEGFTSQPDFREVNPQSLSTKSPFKAIPPLENQRALEFERAAWSATVTLRPLETRFAADATLLIHATDTGLHLTQHVALGIEQGALKKLVLKMPASLPEARVSGPVLRESQARVNGALREYEITFQSQGGLLGHTALTLEMDLPVTDDPLALPAVLVPGAERLRRYLVLDNASTREARLPIANTATGSVPALENTTLEALPYKPVITGQGQFFIFNETGTVNLVLTQLQTSAGQTALVPLATLHTLLRQDGERWDVVTYSLSNRALQFLPVILPDKAELIAVSVSGEPVRADEETRQGKRVRLIPLIQTKPGQRSMDIRLIYRIKNFSLGENVHLDDPDLPGLSIERTVWTATLPPGYTIKHPNADTFGNMEPIAEDSRTIEALQGKLADFNRLNRELTKAKEYNDDNEQTLQEARKLGRELEELTRKVESKVSSSFGRREAPVAQTEGKPDLLAKVGKDFTTWKADFDQQNRALTVNGGTLNKLKSSTLQRAAGKKPQPFEQEPTFSFGGDDDRTNKDRQQAAFDPAKLTGLNDNIALTNDFLTLPQLQQQLTLGGSGSSSVKDVELTKSGAGTLVLSGANTYTGGTTANGGRLFAHSIMAASGDGDSLILGGNNDYAELGYMGKAKLSSDGSADGTLQFSTANTYSGNTIISDGVLTLNSNTAPANVISGTATLGNARALNNRFNFNNGDNNAAGAGGNLQVGGANAAVSNNAAANGALVNQSQLAISGQMMDPTINGGFADTSVTVGRGTAVFSSTINQLPKAPDAKNKDRAGQIITEDAEKARQQLVSGTYSGNGRVVPATPGMRFSNAAIAPDSVDGIARAAKPAAPAVASAPPAPADPFAAPAPPPPAPAAAKQMAAIEGFDLSQIKAGEKDGSLWMSQPGALRVYKEDESIKGGRKLYSSPVMAFSPGLATQSVNQLRPTGRRSLQLDLTGSGETWHFRKLKDHAVLDLTLTRHEPARQTVHPAVFAGSLTLWGLLAWFIRRRKK